MMNGLEPAFACDTSTGLSKRELYAMAAMQGILANPQWVHSCIKNLDANSLDRDVIAEFASKWAIKAADALLAELAKGGSE